LTAPVEETEEAPSKAFLIAGLALLAAAGGLYLWARTRPCGCGEKGVEDIAKASAEMVAERATAEYAQSEDPNG
jgi:hypothetical protein